MAMDTTPFREFLQASIEHEERKRLIGEQISQARRALGQTQTDFARSIGITQAYVSNIESGVRTPSSQTMRSIVNYFSTYQKEEDADQDKDN